MEAIARFLDHPLLHLGGQAVTLAQVLIVPVVIIVGYVLIVWTVRFIARRLTAGDVSADIVQLVSRAFYIAGLAILLITTLDLLNVPLTAFAFISGAIAIGVGFGAQNIINNFISGWILMWERPIRIGDMLEIGDMSGHVEAINTRSTRIRRLDGVHLLVPNSHLLENIVVNWTLVDRLIRSSVRVGVAYGSPVERVAKLIEQAATGHESVLQDPAPLVVFEDFGDNALIFDVFFWVMASGERDLRVIRSDIRFRIDALFKENDIVIAFPQRDVHIDGSIRVEN